MIICGVALGQGFKTPDEMNFQLSPYLGRAVCPKLIQTNLSSIFSSLSTKHQTLPDQMIKYSHNLCSTIAIIFFRVPVQAPPPKKASALLLLSSAKMLVDTYLYVDC